MNIFLIIRILYLFFVFFLPELTWFIYCPIKKRLNNCYRCSYYFCKKYNTCKFNEKTLVDLPKHNHFDFLWWLISVFLILLISIFFYILEVNYGC